MTDPAELVDTVTRRLKPIAVELNSAWWDAAVTGHADAYRRAADYLDQIDRVYADGPLFNALAEARETPPDDDLLARSVELLYLEALPRQIDPALSHRINALAFDVARLFSTYRPVYRSDPRSLGDLEEVLKRERDSARLEEAYEATKTIGPLVASRLHELVELRNEAARHVGFPDFYHLRLRVEEQDVDDLAAFLDRLNTASEAPFTALKADIDERLSERTGLSPSELMPWHYENPFFQEFPNILGTNADQIYAQVNLIEVARTFFAGIGLDVEEVLDHSSLYEAEGKAPNASAIDIDRSGDVRIKLNLRPTERWMGTTLHELGHAVYDLGIHPELPWALRCPSHTLTTEAIAMLFGRLSRNGSWMHDMGLIDQAEAANVVNRLEQELRGEMILVTRWILVMTHFERELYADPGQDLNALWWKLVARYQGLQPPPRPSDAADYAAKEHVVTAPVYYHNYLYGECFASQIDARLQAEVLKGQPTYVGNAGVGAWLTEHIFKPGARSHYDELARAATGEAVGSKAFGEQFLVGRAA